jgi:hypothetical protein
MDTRVAPAYDDVFAVADHGSEVEAGRGHLAALHDASQKYLIHLGAQ